jgi:hypothetical protein
MVTNFSDVALTVPKATVLGIAEEISESTVDKINKQGQPSTNASTEPQNRDKTKALYLKLLKGKLDHLPP